MTRTDLTDEEIPEGTSCCLTTVAEEMEELARDRQLPLDVIYFIGGISRVDGSDIVSVCLSHGDRHIYLVEDYKQRGWVVLRRNGLSSGVATLARGENCTELARAGLLFLCSTGLEDDRLE